jgi:PEP-CTERM motif
VRKWIIGVAALALMPAIARADTFTIECDYNDVAAITGTFTMTPGDWSTLGNVHLDASLPYQAANSGGLLYNAFDHMTFNAVQAPATTGPQNFLVFTNTGLQIAFTPQQIASNIVQTYSVISAIGSHESSAWDSTLTMAWDYFDGSIKDTVTGAPITTGVPEPSTWAMLLLGFAGLAFLFRRRLPCPTIV